MTLRALGIAAACLGLVACSPPVPESGPGFSDYTEFQAGQAARDADLAGSAAPAPAAGSEGPLPTIAGSMPGETDALARARAALEDPEGERPTGSAEPPGAGGASSREDAASPASPETDASGLSNEQDFGAVSEERGIESDAARLAQARAQYQLVTPTPLPERGERSGMTTVEFALATDHPPGRQVYRRSPFSSAARAERNCAGYPTPDRAQAAFLAEGGPERDRLGLDPDGDGYVCGWSPEPFRQAVRP